MADVGGTGRDGLSHWARLRKDTDAFLNNLFRATGTPGTPQMVLAVVLALILYLPTLAWSLISWLVKKLWRIRKWLGLATALAAVVLAGGLIGRWVTARIVTVDPCMQPRELRVVTTPDAYQVLQAEAAGFTAAQKEKDCDVTVSISSVDSFDDLRAAFAHQGGAWQPETRQIPLIPGPHPDIVIPALTAQAERLESARRDGVALVNEGSLATSDVVLATPAGFNLSDEADVHSLLAEARDQRLRIARPDPERSEAALLSTRALYGPGTEQSAADRARLEAELSPSDVRLDSAVAPFCRQGTRDVAIILPRHVFEMFDGDQIPRSLCAGSDLTDVDYEAIKIAGMPALDYPFVRVRWPGQADRERDVLIGEFQTWLRERLPSHGFEAPATAGNGVSERQYRDTLAAHREARQEIQVIFLLDNSGSMRKTVADGRSLDRGGRLISRITDRLGGNDWAALWALPGDGQGGASLHVEGGPVTIEQKRTLKNEVAALRLSAGNYSPVYAGLVHAVQQTANPKDLTVILVTDGENRVPEGRPADDVAFEAAVAELSSAGAHLEVLAVAPEECSFEDLAELPRRPGPGRTSRCLPAAYADVDALVSDVIGRLRAGS